ncbi:MAG: MotA/TolQ/ExbB proton channel family protein [Campylobacterales bacterium]|nr:MotA/TolQ/ExbB proton channel family protein [Campylobacterales bacterium]
MVQSLTIFLSDSHPVTLVVLGVLSIYFIAITWVFVYRFFSLQAWVSQEKESLESLLMGSNSVSPFSYIDPFLKRSAALCKEILDLCQYAATKDATRGLSLLSVVASTSPFIGLFGTVVSILDTFKDIGQASASMSLIAAGVSDALIATAGGIFVAIFAYTFHQLLKRKAYELSGLIRMQSDALMAKSKE